MNTGNCLIIHPILPGASEPGQSVRAQSDQVAEIEGLAEAINLDVHQTYSLRVNTLRPSTFLGKGQVEIIDTMINGTPDDRPDVIIFNHSLTPGQQRNLERAWNVKVIDRTGLILEIFGARAQTAEGKIQVDLAALSYQKSRLVKSWTHLERQRGGAGFLGGPGETQLEIDRRLITQRITKLKKQLEEVRRTRGLGRDQRAKIPFPVVALVGYTNAGKSTLFNRLTGAQVLAKDMLFATLDPTLRRLELPNKQTIILSDTVGFIADLPTQLIAAFRGTLEQVVDADVILHVCDVSASDTLSQRLEVIGVLKDLGIDYETDTRIIEVLNKCDMLPDGKMADDGLDTTFSGHPAVPVSALTGQGIDTLQSQIITTLGGERHTLNITIPAGEGKALAWLYQNAHILETQPQDDGSTIIICQMDNKAWGQYRSLYCNDA
ncbi:MAG: GTPase HflX [Pseudomonadota bacterium]